MFKNKTGFYYKKNKSKDTCVAICFARQVEFENPVINLNIVLSDLKKAGIPVFTIELLYNDQKPVIKNGTLTVHSETLCFSKENLWNLIEEKIPKKYKKIIFLDGDIRFTDPDWFNKSSKVLDDHDVIQPMSKVLYVLPNDYEANDEDKLFADKYFDKWSVAYGLKHGKIKDQIHQCWVGYSVGITRDFFHKMNKFYDRCFVGQGDSIFWMGCAKELPVPEFNRIDLFACSIFSAKKHIENMRTLEPKVGFVDNNVACHLFHGYPPLRNYKSRLALQIHETNFTYNTEGVLYLAGRKTIGNMYMDYLFSRNEDAIVEVKYYLHNLNKLKTIEGHNELPESNPDAPLYFLRKLDKTFINKNGNLTFSELCSFIKYLKIKKLNNLAKVFYKLIDEEYRKSDKTDHNVFLYEQMLKSIEEIQE